jgi:hypothetical protein
MKPYPVLNAPVHPGAVLLLCLLGGFLVTGLLAGAEPLHASTPASTISSYRAADDPQVKVALDDFYNLEYDKAISQFQRIEKAHPEDPFAVVHVL